jgi:hypothetical protein
VNWFSSEGSKGCEIGDCGMDTVVIEGGGEAGLCFEELQRARLLWWRCVAVFGVDNYAGGGFKRAKAR